MGYGYWMVGIFLGLKENKEFFVICSASMNRYFLFLIGRLAKKKRFGPITNSVYGLKICLLKFNGIIEKGVLAF